MDILDSYRTRFVPKEMAFSDAEYRARLSRVRDAMGAHGLDLLLLHHLPSVCYLTGYQTPVSESRTQWPAVRITFGEMNCAEQT